MKYRNRIITYQGIKFSSELEKNRFIYLFSLQAKGVITDLILQPKFVLQDKFKVYGKGIRDITYSADFQYLYNGVTIIEDTKGFKTEAYKIKAKLFLFMIKDETNKRFIEVKKASEKLIQIN